MKANVLWGRLDTTAVAGMAVFASLALVLAAVSQALGLNFPLVPYLQFDVGEVAILLAFFIFGPVPALAASTVEFAGLMVFGQQIPIGPLLKLFSLFSTVFGLWVGAAIASRAGWSGLGRLVGSSSGFGLAFRAAIMTIPNYYVLVFLGELGYAESVAKIPFSWLGITLTNSNALAVILAFTAVFNVLQLLFVMAVTYSILRVPSVSQLRVGGKTPWFAQLTRRGAPPGTPS